MAVTDSGAFSTLGLTGASAALAFLAGLPLALGFTSVAAAKVVGLKSDVAAAEACLVF